MLFEVLRGNIPLLVFVAYLVALTVGMTIHEFAHNYGAYVMGDPSPKYNGRLTLNPLVHIYIPGWIMWAVIGFGVLGFAPIAPERLPLQNRRWRWLVAVAAGPVSNLILAVVVGIIFRVVSGNVPPIVNQMMFYVVFINVFLFLFNLIPLFPIDGWEIMYCLLPPDLAYVWKRYQRESSYVFLGLIVLSFVAPQFNILGWLISGPGITLTQTILGR